LHSHSLSLCLSCKILNSDCIYLWGPGRNAWGPTKNNNLSKAKNYKILRSPKPARARKLKVVYTFFTCANVGGARKKISCYQHGVHPSTRSTNTANTNTHERLIEQAPYACCVKMPFPTLVFGLRKRRGGGVNSLPMNAAAQKDVGRRQEPTRPTRRRPRDKCTSAAPAPRQTRPRKDVGCRQFLPEIMAPRGQRVAGLATGTSDHTLTPSGGQRTTGLARPGRGTRPRGRLRRREEQPNHGGHPSPRGPTPRARLLRALRVAPGGTEALDPGPGANA
jgi:hypothetical protein